MLMLKRTAEVEIHTSKDYARGEYAYIFILNFVVGSEASHSLAKGEVTTH
jgi:hypothetical protein